MKYVGFAWEFMKALLWFAKTPFIIATLLVWIAFAPYIIIGNVGFWTFAVSGMYGVTLITVLEVLAKEIQSLNGKPKV